LHWVLGAWYWLLFDEESWLEDIWIVVPLYWLLCPTIMPSCLPAFLSICLPSYLPAYLPAFLPAKGWLFCLLCGSCARMDGGVLVTIK
jgi:hypothetical protein